MARVKSNNIPLTTQSGSITFNKFDVLTNAHTIICNGGVAVDNGEVIVYGKIGDSVRQIITSFDMKSSYKIAYFRGSYNSLEFEPVGLDGDGQYSIYMISTD